MCGPHFCSMKITQDVRDAAAKHGIAEETAAAGYRAGGASGFSLDSRLSIASLNTV
jgi:phosphomethylpyrimidine synthase